MLSNRLRRRKTVWMAIIITHRLLFLGVLVGPMPFMPEAWRMPWIIGFLFLHDAMANTSGPMFLSWMADLLPRESLNRHWASRQRFITTTNVLVMAALGFGFDFFERRDLVIEGFAIIAGAGVVLGIIDILLFIWIPEPEQERVENVRLREILLQPLRDKEFRPFLAYRAYWTFGVSLAAPFFGLYMIDELGLRVVTVQLMGIGSALGVVVASRFWGLLCDTYGSRPCLQLLTMGKFLPPLAFFVVPHDHRFAIPFLTCFMIFDGSMNAGMMLATQGILLKNTPRRNRTMYIAASSFLSVGIVAAIGPVAAGYLVEFLNKHVYITFGIFVITGYHGAFLLSACWRFGALFMVSRINEPASLGVREVLAQIRGLTAIRVARKVYRLREGRAPAERAAAACELAAIGHPLCMNELTHALEDEDREVREAAAHALGEIGVAEATQPLAKALFDPESGIQGRAAQALGRIGGTESLQALLANLRNLDSQGLRQTIDALADLGHDAAYLPLICLFHDVEDPGLRDHIARALARLSRTEAMEEVLDLLHARRPDGMSPIR